MEIFLILVLIVLVIWFGSRNDDRLNALERKINELKAQLTEKTFTSPSATEGKKEVSKENIPAAPAPEVKPVYTSTPVPKPVEQVKPSENLPPVKPPVEKQVFVPKPANVFIPTPKPAAPPKPTFFERNPDLEKFIGENLINKIGIAVLVLGIGFFVKYAIDQNWINEFGRVAIGIFCGGILLGVAHYLRAKFKAFSSVLVGGGLAVLYFTIAIAFHQYHLFDQTVAFIIMVVITAFAVFLALAYDRMEIAVLSVIGGFSSPFIVSTGEGNYIVLFTYLMILNVGMLVLAYFKKWNLINIVSYVFTVIIYGAWLIREANYSTEPHYLGALVFGSLFYFVFFLMNIIHNIKQSKVFGMLDFTLLISNSFLYYGASMYVLHNISNADFQGMYTVGLGVFNFGFAYVLYKRQGIDRNLVFLLIGLVLSFISLAAPVQLQGHYITLFWSAEAALLLWLSQKSGIKLMKLVSVIIMALMLISLLMDWHKVYYEQDIFLNPNYTPLAILLNKGFMTGMVSVIAMFLSIFFLQKETDKYMYGWFDIRGYRIVLAVLTVLVLYTTMYMELNYQLYFRIGFSPACEIVLGFYNLLFLAGLNIYAMRKNIPIASNIIIAISAVALLFYIFFYNYQVVLTRNDYLNNGHATLVGYMFHYLTAISAFVLLLMSFRHVKKMNGLDSDMGVGLLWFSTLIIVYITSAELTHVFVMQNYGVNHSIADIISQSSKIGWPILWGICSFVLMIIGMRLKMRHLRIISLSLFFITLLKLFLFDIRDVSEGGKIAAFISLGIILLVVSFMYQKLKLLILSEDQKQNQKKDE
ncbi:MAG TPA: DUF2339 domain-containing protein [Bacteroidia bacterium]|jgi:uncharacterized membrane protein|nr:DUF2339 domain-containing protein [Bacteroidia bacterium]